MVIPAGETIKEMIEDRGVSMESFASRMQMTEEQAELLIAGILEVTPDIAVKLENVLGVPAKFWINLERIHKEKLAKENRRE